MEIVNINDLVLDPQNPRRINKHLFKSLCNSLKKDPNFLKLRPVLVNRTKGQLLVYAGNQRVSAAKKLNWKQIPCIIEDDLDPEVVLYRKVKDNFHSGEWDYELLGNYFDTDFLKEIGFSDVDLGLDVPEKPKKEKKPKHQVCPSCGYKFDS